MNKLLRPPPACLTRRHALALIGLTVASRAAAAPRGPVLVMRHAQTEPGIGDPPGFVLGRCDTQRNLSDAGRAEARRFGERLAARFGPPREIRSSRWCRGLDTAAEVALGLGAGVPSIDPWPVLDSFFEGRGDAAAQTAAARQRLRTLAAARGYELWVTHQVNVSALCGESLPMGGALWLQPAADGGVRALALDP